MKRMVTCLVVAMLISFNLSAVDDRPMIIKDGKANAEIIISPEPTRTVKLGAAELQLFIKKISGTELPILSEPSGTNPIKIYIGESAYTRELGLLETEFKDDSYRIVSGKDYLAFVGDEKDRVIVEPFPKDEGDMERAQAEWDKISGGLWQFLGRLQKRGFNEAVGVDQSDKKGTLTGVYDFLRSLGVRWYFPGELGECVPEMKSIALPEIDKSVTPDFTMRIMGGRNYTFSKIGREQCLWCMRMGFGGTGPNAMHGVNHILRNEGTVKARPDWYRLKDGKREASIHGRPCLYAAGFREEMIKYGKNQFDMYNVRIFSVTPTDGYVNICECDLCRPHETPDRGRKGNMSDYVWGYANDVARALYKTHPDRKVQCNSYTSYALPPLKIEKLSPNMTIMFQQNRYKFGDPEVRKNFLDSRKTWLKKLHGERPLSNHDNYTQMGRSPFPMFIPRLIAEDMRSLKGISYGDYVEENSKNLRRQESPVSLAVNHLNVYVTARCWWDADLDIDALLDEYYETFYGSAAEEMKAFIEFSEANWEKMKKNKDVALVDRSFELIDMAREAVGSETIYGQRIELIDRYLYKLRQLRGKLAMNRDENGRIRIYTTQTVELDGNLDERVWQFGHGHKLKMAANESWYRTGWSYKGGNLYFAVHCEVPDMRATEGATTEDDDPAILEGDRIEVLLETQNHSFYQIVVNPAGAVYDADWKDGPNPRWNSDAEVAIHTGDNYWDAEIMIPIADEMQEENLPLLMVSGRRPNMVETYFFNIARFNQAGEGTPDFYDPDKFKVLYME